MWASYPTRTEFSVIAIMSSTRAVRDHKFAVRTSPLKCINYSQSSPDTVCRVNAGVAHALRRCNDRRSCKKAQSLFLENYELQSALRGRDSPRAAAAYGWVLKMERNIAAATATHARVREAFRVKEAAAKERRAKKREWVE